MQRSTLEVQVGRHKISFETGQIAHQANGSVMVRCGDTMVFAAACAKSTPSPDIDFLPLRVDYQEKFSSAGRTPGGFLKRESKPSEREVLTCRLIDRPLRPTFPKGFTHETQLLSYCFSYDQENPADVLAILACAAALLISDIPLQKPLAAVRVGRISGEFIINPSIDEMMQSDLDLVIAGTAEAILMIEGYCDFLPEDVVAEAIETGHRAIAAICEQLALWKQEVGKAEMAWIAAEPSKELLDAVQQLAEDGIRKALTIAGKQEREEVLSRIRERAYEQLLADYSQQTDLNMAVMAKLAIKQLESQLLRQAVEETGRRLDGRAVDEVRPISIELQVLPRAHGSALFTRGETQALAVCTLGGESSGQRYEDLHGEGLHRFYLQYSFPPFSVGEVGRVGPPGRREIGHGKLAERALRSCAPKQPAYPYTIRLESNIMACNGSSSMASVCGGCLAMMDAGVPIERPVAGIAMGLILSQDRYTILSDILGAEDALGDMDFKVTGDAEGITAFQMDIKVEGITSEIMKAALAQAKKGRTHILECMLAVCPETRKEMSAHAPRIETMNIKPSLIGAVIGPGGKMIRSIVEASGAQIDINDEGVVAIASSNAESLQRAKEMIFNLTAEVEVGQTYKGEIVSVVDFGCFVKIFGKEYLCHVSELSHERIENPKDQFKPGEFIEVKVIGQNDRGQLKLSRKALLPKPAK